MKRQKFFAFSAALLASVLVLSSFSLAQNPAPARDVPRGGGESTGMSGSSAPPSAVNSVSSRDNTSSVGVPSFSSSNAPSMRTSIPSNFGGYSAAGSGGNGGSYVPNYNQFINDRTSFYSYDSYIRSQMLFDLLRLYYGSAFSSQYFSRYYMNTEPILNRKMLYYSLQKSAGRAEQLQRAASELNTLLSEYYRSAAGESAAVRDPRYSELAGRIRTLARQIKDDEFLPCVDVRKGNSDASIKTTNLEKLSYTEQASRLAELGMKLGSQLSGMINDPNPAVISVNTLTQPTLESLAREIERVAKNLEKATRS